MLEMLSVGRRTDELLIRTTLLLSTGFAQFTLSVHLMVEIQLDEVLLLLFLLKALQDLNISLFWAKVRLIIEGLYSLFSFFLRLLVKDLIAKIFTISCVLVLPILCLNVLHAIHVVHGLIELGFLVLSYALNALSLLCKAINGLFVRFTNGIV